MALAGKRAVVFGVCNKWSLAWAVARAWRAAGAQLTLACRSDRERGAVEALAASLAGEEDGESGVSRCRALVCDVADESAIRAVFDHASAGGALKVHSVLHSVAAAPPGALAAPLLAASSEDFLSTQLVSAYSLIAIARCALPVMEVADHPDAGGPSSTFPSASITSLTYIGASRLLLRTHLPGHAPCRLRDVAARRVLS